MRKPLLLVIGVALATALSACYESPKVALHEPGVYKGKEDPLLKGQGEQRQENLRKRFDMVQLDR